MGAENDTDFLNSGFPMWAAGGVGVFAAYRAYMVSILLQNRDTHILVPPHLLLAALLL